MRILKEKKEIGLAIEYDHATKTARAPAEMSNPPVLTGESEFRGIDCVRGGT